MLAPFLDICGGVGAQEKVSRRGAPASALQTNLHTGKALRLACRTKENPRTYVAAIFLNLALDHTGGRGNVCPGEIAAIGVGLGRLAMGLM